MGKYMRKSKAAAVGDLSVAAMEMSTQSSLGVRTRAKTLALRKLQQSSACGGSYLQLRSRKLEKPAKRQKQYLENPSPSCKTRASSKLGVSTKLKVVDEIEQIGNGEGEPSVEAENSSNFAGLERTNRESTPCSFTGDLDNAGTPGSSTSAPSSTKISKRTQNSPHKIMPKAKEVEKFFAGAEEEQHRQFIEKYNFDPVKEKPLPGKYCWVKTDDV